MDVNEYKILTKKYIKKHEDFSAIPYNDPIHGSRVKTVGYGHVILPNESFSPMNPLTKRQADALLDKDFDRHCGVQKMEGIVSNFRSLPVELQASLGDMAFNLGEAGLKGFVKFRGHIESRNFSAAADEMMNSKWAGQVKTRAVFLSDKVRNASASNNVSSSEIHFTPRRMENDNLCDLIWHSNSMYNFQQQEQQEDRPRMYASGNRNGISIGISIPCRLI